MWKGQQSSEVSIADRMFVFAVSSHGACQWFLQRWLHVLDDFFMIWKFSLPEDESIDFFVLLRYNLHTIKFTNWSCRIQSCLHSCVAIITRTSASSAKNSVPAESLVSSPHPYHSTLQTWAILNPLVSVDLPVLDTLDKWNHLICSPLCLIYLALLAFMGCPCHSMCPNFIPFCNSPLLMDTTDLFYW